MKKTKEKEKMMKKKEKMMKKKEEKRRISHNAQNHYNMCRPKSSLN